MLCPHVTNEKGTPNGSRDQLREPSEQLVTLGATPCRCRPALFRAAEHRLRNILHGAWEAVAAANRTNEEKRHQT